MDDPKEFMVNAERVQEALRAVEAGDLSEAAKLLGMTEVPTVCLSHMSEAEKRAYVIADNRLAEKAGWDAEILAIEFETLFEIAPEFDLTVTRHRMRQHQRFKLRHFSHALGQRRKIGRAHV